MIEAGIVPHHDHDFCANDDNASYVSNALIRRVQSNTMLLYVSPRQDSEMMSRQMDLPSQTVLANHLPCAKSRLLQREYSVSALSMWVHTDM